MKKNITTAVWIKYFPFEHIRPLQEESINFILNSFINLNKKYVICELPTGIGKSAIAVTVSRYFEAELTDQKNASWILTTQKILQKQYQSEFAWLPTVWSKSNYECKKHYGVSCQLGLWINNIFKGKYCDCIYTADKNKFLESQISLTNVQFFLNHYEYQKDAIKKRKLLIVDEAHNLENIITDFVSITINKYVIIDYGINWIGTNKSIVQVMDWVKKILIPKLTAIKTRLEIEIKSSDRTALLSSPEGKLLMKQYDSTDRYICQLSRCVERFNPNEWVMSVNNDDELILRPLFASRFSEKQLFETADKVLLMSGTILDKQTYCKNVGIPLQETAFISLPSPFKEENRPVFIVKAASLSYKNIDNSLPKIATVVKKIMTDHKDEKGIIHCVNENTNIKMGNNYFKKIIELNPGDIIQTYNEKTNNIENKKVKNIFDNGMRECIKLVFENNKELICTPDHLILTKSRGWVKAIELTGDDDIISDEL